MKFFHGPPSKKTRAATPMKLHRTFKLLSLLLLSGSAAKLQAQVTLVNWNQTWDYMQPMGAQPDRPAGGTDDDFETTWFLKASDFATQYDGPTFGGATVAGDVNTPNSYDHGSGPGPLGYAAMDYWAVAGAQVTANGTTLTTPNSGSRYTSYYRTTFTVPNDGKTYSSPVITYLMDDGGFVYLDGVLILDVNMSGAPDTYFGLAANTTDTESQLRVADLTLPAGSATGGLTTTNVTNAMIVQPVATLAPGVHTLAVSSHNQATGSSDLGFAFKLTAGPVTPQITNVRLNSSQRNLNGTPGVLTDDTVDFSIVVTGAGPSGWVVSGPAGSSVLGQTDTYGAIHSFTAVPIAEFSSGSLVLTVKDATDPTVTGTVTVTAPVPVIDWSQTWDYVNPMGAIPDSAGGPAGTPDPDFETTWYLKASDFATQYNGPVFGGAQVIGDPATLNSYDGGSGPGPLGFDIMDYWATAGALFTTNGTVLTAQASGSRYTTYLRTTFTIPNDGSTYSQPGLKYLIDDGAFIYLDGVLILTVNMPVGSTDTYLQLATNATNTEDQLRTADLTLPAGTATGTHATLGSNNATIDQPVTTLTPGAHTLAVSVHNSAVASSDQGFALQLTSVISGGGGTGNGDTDGDGVSDANETIEGTDPNNAADVLRLSQNPATPTQINFPSKAGKFYKVYSSTDLNTWTNTGLATIAGDGTAKSFNVTTTGATRRFYRLAVMGTDGPWP
jgi:hypothetical protein